MYYLLGGQNQQYTPDITIIAVCVRCLGLDLEMSFHWYKLVSLCVFFESEGKQTLFCFLCQELEVQLPAGLPGDRHGPDAAAVATWELRPDLLNLQESLEIYFLM